MRLPTRVRLSMRDRALMSFAKNAARARDRALRASLASLPEPARQWARYLARSHARDARYWYSLVVGHDREWLQPEPIPMRWRS